MNGIEPFAYLRAVFERIADYPINRMEDLQPWCLDLNPSARALLAA